MKASPHIESKVKTWKKDYEVVYDMINTSGFGWNNVRKCVEVDSNEAWHSYVQVMLALLIFTIIFFTRIDVNGV